MSFTVDVVAMERTDDFLRIVELYKTDVTPDPNMQRKSEIRPSQYLCLAQRVASSVESNEALVRRMDTRFASVSAQ